MRSMHRTGSFTLVELMIVITIIVALMALMALVAGTIPDRAKAAVARSDIKSISAAINEYKRLYGSYPPDGVNNSVDLLDEGTAVMLEHIDGDGYLPYNDDRAEIGKNKKFLELKAEMLGDARGNKKEDVGFWNPEEQPELLDPWGRPYQYLRNVNDKGRSTDVDVSSQRGGIDNLPDPRLLEGIYQPRNKKSFDLWSHGIDPNSSDDDITNW